MERGAALFHGSLYGGAGDADRKAAFLNRLVAGRPARIIDAAAGVGDVAFRLAGMGHLVFAFEPCGPMFSVLFDRFQREVAIRHLVAPFPIAFESCPVNLSADLVVSSNHWSHLDATCRRGLVRRVIETLAPAGALVFNCAQETPLRCDQPRGEVHKRVFGDLAIRHFASSSRVPGAPTVHVRFEYVMEYSGCVVHTESEEFFLTLDTPDAVTSLLRAAGYGKIEIRGGFADTEYDPRLPGFVVIARTADSE